MNRDYKPSSKWISSIKVYGKQTRFGYFTSKEGAVKARDQYIIDNKIWEYKLQILNRDGSIKTN